MKKQILLTLVCLYNIFTIAYVNGQSNKIGFSIEKELVSGNTQLLIKIAITNNTTSCITLPGLSNSDEYGNPLEGGVSNISALAYNANGVMIKESDVFDLIRSPFYSLNSSVKLNPGESYKHAYLLYAVYNQGPWSLFGIKPIPDLTTLELKLHLLYLTPALDEITIDKVSNRIPVFTDMRIKAPTNTDYKSQQPFPSL